MTSRHMILLNPQSSLWIVNKSTLSVIIFAKNIYFAIILLSQTVVRIFSRQPFFYAVRYSFPRFYIFPGNRKTRRTEVLRVSYVWTQRTLRYSIFRYIRSTRLRFRYASSRSGIRPVSPSSNILIRVNSHRIFSSSLHCSLLIEYYSITVATRPDPTVRPPSRLWGS